METGFKNVFDYFDQRAGNKVPKVSTPNMPVATSVTRPTTSPVAPLMKPKNVFDYFDEKKAQDTSGTLSQADVLADPDKIGKVRDYMIARKGAEWREASDEDVLDQFVTHMRWVNTNELNTIGEARAVFGADEETKAKFGEGFKVYDEISSVFSNGFLEAGEGILDYTAALATSPSTYLGGILGRTVSKAGTKAAQKAMMAEASKAVAKVAQQGVGKEAAVLARKEVISAATKHNVLKASLVATAADATMASAQDALYQATMMEAGAQDKFNVYQSAAAAITGLAGGLMAMAPEMTRGMSGLEDVGGKISEARRIRSSRAAKEAAPEIKAMVDKIATDWLDATKRGEAADANFFVRSKILDTFLDLENENSLVRILQRAGADLKTKDGASLSSSILDFANGLSDEAKSQFDEALAPLNLRFGEMMDIFAKAVRESGQTLNKVSIASKFMEDYKNVSVAKRSAIQDVLASEKNKPAREANVFGYTQSLWKKLIVSHPATTMVNVKGWGAAYLGRALSEVVQMSLYGGVGLLDTLVNPARGARRLAEAKALMQSQAFMFRTVVDPFTSVSAFSELMSRAPQKVQREALDTFFGGVSDETAAAFGLSADNMIVRNLEKASEAAAKVSLVRVQDIYTKSLSGLKALDTESRLAFNKGLEQLINDGESYKITDQMWERVIDSMLKDTFSQDYTKGGPFSSVAKVLEDMSNVPGVGFIFPFGRFVNNTVAFVGAYSPIGLAQLASKAYRNNATSMDIGEKISKAIVGTTALSMMAFREGEKQKEGLQWYEERNDGGDIQNVGTIFPYSLYNLVGRIIHNTASGEGGSRDLVEELKRQVGPLDALATLGDGGTISDIIRYLAEVDEDPESFDTVYEVFRASLGIIGGIGAGFTRPLDVPNDLLGTALDMTGTVNDVSVDRKQADGVLDTTLLGLSRYTGTFFSLLLGEEDEQGRLLYGKPMMSATEKGPVKDPNPVSTLTGKKLEPRRSNIDKALAIIDMPPFKANSFTTGMPEYDAFMNDEVFDTLERKASKLLKSPGWAKASAAKRRDLVRSMIKNARDEVLNSIEQPYVGNINPQLLNARRTLMAFDQSLRAEAKIALGIKTKDRDLTGFQIKLIKNWIENERESRKGTLEGL